MGKRTFESPLSQNRLSDNGMTLYRKAAEEAGLSFDVVDSNGHGSGPSFLSQIDVALQDPDDTLAFI